jgi:opacity protein-like surface antigen
MNLLEENRLKLEFQPVLWKELGESSYTLSGGASYQATSDLALRAMYEYTDQTEDNRIVFQVYYYKGM